MTKTAGHDPDRPRPPAGPSDPADGTATGAAGAAREQQLGEHAAVLLATEHWSLLSARSLIWNEAQNRVTVFLTLLSASIVALALLADATGFGDETTTLALVLLPVVFLLGVAAYARLVQINIEEFQLVLAMNRLRSAYLALEPGLERYLTTSPHDDEQGVFATYIVAGSTRKAAWIFFFVNTPTIIATVDAALAAAMAVLGLQAAEVPLAVTVPAGVAVFVLVSATLYWLQAQSLRPFRHQTPRFPSPPGDS